MTSARATVTDLVLVVAVGGAGTVLLVLLGLPSPVLFGGLLGGLAHALSRRTALEVPLAATRVAQGLIGATVGAMVTVPALQRMGSDLLEIVLVTTATLVLSLAAGLLLSLRRDVSAVTGVFGLIAGGASGVVAVAHQLGADDRVVAVVQYLRVLLVLATMPLVTALVFAPVPGAGELLGTDPRLLPSLAYVGVAVGGGLVLGRLAGFATAYLLGPLLIGVLLVATGWLGPVGVPDLVESVAYALIGVQVGLRFTRESLAAITRMLPAVLLLIATMILGCAGLGAILAGTTSADALTGYLATTPGGLWAVLALAAESGSDVTYVTAVQLFRLLVILALTPLLASWLRRWAEGPR